MHRRTLLGLSSVLPWLSLPSGSPQGDSVSRDLGAAIDRLEAIDTHEHILPEAERVALPVDVFTLASHYAVDDLTSAGLPEADRARLLSPTEPADRKWAAFSPWWAHTQHTGYGQALRLALRDIYGIDHLDATSLPTANARIRERNRPGLYADILKGRARLRFCVNDEYWQPRPVPVDPAVFVLARKFDQYVTPVTRAGVGRLEQQSGRSIARLRDLQDTLEAQFDAALAAGMVTVKTTMAYLRSLRFEVVSVEAASQAFESLMRDRTPPPADAFAALDQRPYKPLSDFMFHQLVQLADAHRVPVQVHTGLHAGNGNIVTNSRPADLTNLFYRYPRVTFDVFHVGFPYQHEAAVLAKTFPNACLDFCWMYVVSPTAAAATLHEVLDMVPANKVMGFGGDYRYPELSYAHAVMARRVIGQVLGERVTQRVCTDEEALTIARQLLHDNPARLFSPRAAG